MKKLKFNSTLNHKQSDYKTREIIVEKVITLYGKSFSELKDHPLRDDPYIAENRDLMYIDSNDVAHCLLMVDYDSGDGILVESEGMSYARKSQFIPNVRALVENNELTASERKLHNSLKKMVDHIAELAHCGENSFVFEELLEKSDLDLKSLLRDSVTAMLQEREDIQIAESHSIDVDFQPDITVEAKPTQELTLYCPLHIVREYDESEYEFDEEVLDEPEVIPSRYAIDCAKEINDFIQDYSEPEEEHRGLMVYFDRNPAVSEKVFSAIPSVKEINGELMGVFECQITEELTGSELEDLRSHLIGQCSDGFFEGMEQHQIKTAELGEIYVSFWNDSNDWSLQTSEEMGLEQTEDLSEEPEINMTM
ncbi:MAG TPA: DUF6329 domain-containing protein [Ruminococcus sp.]